MDPRETRLTRPSLRRYMVGVAALALGLSILPGARSATVPKAPGSDASPVARTTAPNIVLILTDDQRWDTLGTKYMPKVKSLLIQHGVYFPNAFVVNSLCCPSRTSILTGEYSHSTDVYDNSGTYGGFHSFHQDSSTVATWLQGGGYRTGLIGKYLLPMGTGPVHPAGVGPLGRVPWSQTRRGLLQLHPDGGWEPGYL